MNDMYVGKLPKALNASCMVTMDLVVILTLLTKVTSSFIPYFL